MRPLYNVKGSPMQRWADPSGTCAGLLKQLQLDNEGFSVEGTPRRLVVRISQLAHRQPQSRERVRGPPAKVGPGLRLRL